LRRRPRLCATQDRFSDGSLEGVLDRLLTSAPSTALPAFLLNFADRSRDFLSLWLEACGRADAHDASGGLGDLPEWDLSDLYPAPDAKEFKRDMDWLEEACASFAADYEQAA